LFARNEQSGRWTGPAFYDIAAASVGFQAGVSVSETVTLVMTQKGLELAAWRAPPSLGGDASIAAGPVWRRGPTPTSQLTSSRSAGRKVSMVALNLEGSVIHVSDTVQQGLTMGAAVLPPDILSAKVHNPQADRFIGDLGRTASRQKTSSAQ
jgi:lipid-binding SYLF domain-containing protein